jgi:uncharacterized RDD family membrane protein YckC
VDQHVLVTPEGVLLDIETAGLASRVLARALDIVILGVVLLLVLLALATVGPPFWLVVVVAVTSIFLAVFVYPVILEAGWRGRTVGKAAVGLRVLTTEGGPVGLRHAAVRSMLGVVDLIATSGFAGVVAIVLSPRDQRLGDLAAGTIVVRDREAFERRAVGLVAAPPGYEAYAAAIDTSALTVEEVATGREVLDRQPRLTGNRGRDLIRRYADFLDQRLGSVRPPQMDRGIFVACVVTSHQGAGAAPQRLLPAPPPAGPGRQAIPPSIEVSDDAAGTGLVPPG